MANYHSKVKCVLCSSKVLTKITNFPDTPIANQLFRPDELPLSGQKFVPLNLLLCSTCHHIQIDTLVDPTILFANYPYVSNSSSAMALRLENVAKKYVSMFNLKKGDLVLEIGSNDGYLLSQIASSGCSVLGVDPAINATDIAIRSGIPTIVDYFSTEVAQKILKKNKLPSLIIANNVLAHSDNLQDIFEGISQLMSLDTTTVIEYSYVVDVFEKLLFDTIYHEHTSYHSISPLQKFLVKFGLLIFNIERFDAHGGSARIYLKKIGGSQAISISVQSAIDYENRIGIHSVASWKDFNSRILQLSEKLQNEISEIRAKGESLLGYGVPAKFTSLFHILGLKENDFDFIVDDNYLKVGKFAPGTKIRITLPENTPSVDNAVIFSWNYSTSIIEKIKKTESVLNKILVPLPEFEIIELSRDRHNQ